MWTLQKALRRAVRGSCLAALVSVSFRVKAERKYESGCKGRVKKASYRSRMVKSEFVGGMLEWKVSRLVTTGQLPKGMTEVLK